ncbi:hypothetical protein ASU63_14715 [Enterobacter hormaechei subsp. xiangfangensis]|nr:hypothetical protein ABF76_00150 [Enterobacter hormaechei subsp. xiangfangensis]KTJ38983.1 hypothetical protein ASU84_11250 [Enterobacter hormaechei subsp. xiangfangensis]KTK31328.1 hypothetical protein ASU63_14715 [Enterobacter hormaechei subsp. xiangfangensis]SAD25005.1 Uncharacterised protein [Enterobacter cloacae]
MQVAGGSIFDKGHLPAVNIFAVYIDADLIVPGRQTVRAIKLVDIHVHRMIDFKQRRVKHIPRDHLAG